MSLLPLKKLISPKNPIAGAIRSSVPDDCRVYAIGDIHGRADILSRMHDIILEDARTATPGMRLIVVYLGDYLDRGMHSREVIELLTKKPLPGFEAIYLKGNHDQKLLDFLDNFQTGSSWLSLGGTATIYSYGVRLPNDLRATERLNHIQRELKKLLPDDHLNFLKGLKSFFSIGGYFFVHAGIDPNRPLGDQKSESFIWGNKNFLKSDNDFGKVIVHGHTVNNEPVILDNRICIDTGAFLSNILTCLVLEKDKHHFLSAETRD